MTHGTFTLNARCLILRWEEVTNPISGKADDRPPQYKHREFWDDNRETRHMRRKARSIRKSVQTGERPAGN